MDDTLQAARDALRQCFHDLTTEFWKNHMAWQEAVRVHDRPRQSALITREGELIADVQEVMATYQALIAQRPR